ncbi:MAG TPA: MarR family winged helix-turn-helix transcriptional regulator [Natronosporangium sp.]
MQAISAQRQPATSDSDAPPDRLAAAFVRLVRQLKARHSADPAMGCLSVLSRLGPVRISRLADELLLDISTTSRHVRNLEAAGLLSRETDPADQRATLLTVTPAGDDYLREGLARFGRALAGATVDWSDQDLATLTDLLNRLADDLGRPLDRKPDSKERT